MALPGTPVIRLVFNQPVTKDSVESALRFADQPGLTAAPDPYDREVFYVLPLPGERRERLAQLFGSPRSTTMGEKRLNVLEIRVQKLLIHIGYDPDAERE